MNTARRVLLGGLTVVLVTVVLILARAPLTAQQVVNGQFPVLLRPCTAAHKDAAVNVAVTVQTVTPPVGQYVYLCGWDFQVVENATGTAQTNVLFTSTNLNGLAAEYSAAAVPNSMVSGAFQYGMPVQAAAPGFPITIISPAAATNNAYSVNVYYQIGP